MNRLEMLTKKMLNKGLNYRVTLTENIKVELLDASTNFVIGEKYGERMENIIESLLLDEERLKEVLNE